MTLRALLDAACSDYVPWTQMSKAESDFIAYCFLHGAAIADLIDGYGEMRRLPPFANDMGQEVRAYYDARDTADSAWARLTEPTEPKP